MRDRGNGPAARAGGRDDDEPQRALLGLADRGTIAPGLRADINLIDPSRLALRKPRLVHDLPAGGRRFLQKAEGYVRTWVAGRPVQRDGEPTGERPGRLVRLGRP